MATPITVLLADDSDTMRKAICQRLGDDPDIELVAEAQSYSELLEMAHDLKPHVIVLDAHIIDTAQAESATVKTLAAVSRIIAISAFSDDSCNQTIHRVVGGVAPRSSLFSFPIAFSCDVFLRSIDRYAS